MISMCTFGKLVFAGMNNGRAAAKRFKSQLDHICLRAIMSRFHRFNERGGAFVRMQDDIVHFERACLVGIFADLPAAAKLLLTGSSCNTCFLPENRMAEPHATAPLRTWRNMEGHYSSFKRRIEAGEPAGRIRTEAGRIGVNFVVKSAFAIPASGINPIGPDPDLDNPWSNCPPVFLHGMEAGTLMKFSYSALRHIIHAADAIGIQATTICRVVDAFCAKVYAWCPRNSNIEIGGMALLPMPHGITAHILGGKTLDGHKRASVFRFMHMFIATSDLFTDHMRAQQCAMFDQVWECREQMSWPLHVSNLADVQARLDDMDRKLVSYMLPWSDSGCRSEKHHQWAHYSHHRRQTGCAAKEYAFERSYAVGHKKQVQFTNKSKTKALQTSQKHWFRTGVQRLANHLGIHDDTVATNTESTPDALRNVVRPMQFKWPSAAVRVIMREKASHMVPPLTRAATTLHVTLKNRLTQHNKPGRMHDIVLRAKPSGAQRWVDNIRIQYRDDANVSRVGFGKCLGFFGDASNNNHVAIQWFKICGRQPIDRVARMTKVELTDIFQYVPAASILNGAFMVPLATEPLPGYPHQFWVIQSHRESTTLTRRNA